MISRAAAPVLLWLLAALLAPAAGLCADDAQAPADDPAGVDLERREHKQKFMDLAPYPLMLSGALLSLERTRAHSYPNAYDLTFPMGGDNTLRMYRNHSALKTTSEGIEWTRHGDGGTFRRWEISGFETTPLLHDAVGVKYSRNTGRKRVTYAFVHAPNLDAGRDLDSLSTYILAYDHFVTGRTRKIPGLGALRAQWGWQEQLTLSMFGETPGYKALNRARRDYRVTIEPRGNSLVQPYAFYNQGVDLQPVIRSITQMPGQHDLSDWGEMLLMDRTAGAGLTAQLSNGAVLNYALETDRHLRTRRDTASLRMPLRGLDLAVIYSRDRGDRSFTTPWYDERTRVQITRDTGGLSWGAFFEFRPGETVSGVSLLMNAEENTPLPLISEHNYREPYEEPGLFQWHTGTDLCGAYSTYEQAAAGLNTPQRIAEYAECLNTDPDADAGKVSPPEDIFAGTLANCHSRSWFQAQLLTQHGYQAWVVVFQGNETLFGQNVKNRFSAQHAVTVYRDPQTGGWNVMDQQGILTTSADTIQEALEAYSPGILGFIVEEPDSLQWQGMFYGNAVQTIDDWIRDAD